MNANWKQAKKDLRAIGVTVNTSLKGCCLGCVENSPIPKDVPAIYQLSKRFSATYGGFLCHSNLGDTALAAKVMAVLNDNGISWSWDGSPLRSIEITLEAY